jgi:rod shape-determining protein MreC
VKLLSKLKEKNFLFSMFITIALIFFMGHRAFVKTPGALEVFASYCVYPLLVLQKTCVTPIEYFIKHKKTVEQLDNIIKDLQLEKESLKAKLIEQTALLQFNQELQEIQNFKKRYDTKHAYLGHIIMRRFNAQEQSFFIDIGSHHGIKPDMAVVYKNHILGKIEQVYPYYSKVLSITDKRCKISAYCAKSQTQGILQGSNNLQLFELAHVDRLKKLVEEDQIFSSGEGTVFPKGFLLGTIESFEPEGVHYRITIKPALDFSTISYCYVMQKGAEITMQALLDTVV